MQTIERTEAIGTRRDLTGTLLVETPNGWLHRMNGRARAAFVESNPWLKAWRLPDGEDDERE